MEAPRDAGPGLRRRASTSCDLWQGAWIAALLTGVIVWGLIFYVVLRFRRRSDDEIPVQTRYNLPLEIFYTIAPIMMVIVFFDHTVDTPEQRPRRRRRRPTTPSRSSASSGRGRSTTASGDGRRRQRRRRDDRYPYSTYVYEAGTAADIPDAVLPVGRDDRFNLHSPDVIHDFGVPGFLMKMDVIPGRVQPLRDHARPGSAPSRASAAELCGVYHSRMLFNVKVVEPRPTTSSTSRTSQAAGQTSGPPLLGGADANTQAGLESGTSQEARSDRHRCTARRPSPAAQDRSASRSSGSSPPPTTS